MERFKQRWKKRANSTPKKVRVEEGAFPAEYSEMASSHIAGCSHLHT